MMLDIMVHRHHRQLEYTITLQMSYPHRGMLVVQLGPDTMQDDTVLLQQQ